MEGPGAGVWGPTDENGAKSAPHLACSHKPSRTSGTPAGAALAVKLHDYVPPVMSAPLHTQRGFTVCTNKPSHAPLSDDPDSMQWMRWRVDGYKTQCSDVPPWKRLTQPRQQFCLSSQPWGCTPAGCIGANSLVKPVFAIDPSDIPACRWPMCSRSAEPLAHLLHVGPVRVRLSETVFSRWQAIIGLCSLQAGVAAAEGAKEAVAGRKGTSAAGSEGDSRVPAASKSSALCSG